MHLITYKFLHLHLSSSEPQLSFSSPRLFLSHPTPKLETLNSSFPTQPNMIIQTHHPIKLPVIINLSVILIICTVYTTPLLVSAVETRRLDETTTPAAPNGSEKCTPCGNSSPPPSPPYYSSPPPPPPNYPPPPPPYEYSSPPPPKKNPPSSQYCPPPPASLLYITGPPGNLYPVDENFNGASRRSFAAALPLILAGLLTVLAIH